MSTITVTHERGEVERLDFDPETRVIDIGRRASNDVCIADRSVSGAHARISVEDGAAWIEDLDSTNGTYVNGRLVSRRRLEENDEIIVGRVRVAFALDAANAAADAPSFEAEALAFESGKANEPADEEGDEADDVVHLPGGSLEPARDTPPARAYLQPVETPPEEAAGGSPTPARPVAPAHPLDGLENELSKQPMHELDSDRATSRGAVIEIKNGAKSGQILPIDKPVTTLGRPGIQIAAIMRKPDGYFLMHIESDDNIERPTLNRDSIGDEPVLLHSGDELNVAGIDVEFMLS